MNAFNRMIKNLVLIAILFFSISINYGQVNKTVGTRITDVTTEKELKTNAILDLESTTKGFFLPRMTTIQRDAIKKEKGKDNGLAVYNIDNDCIEYWSERTEKWMSVCGSLPPAKLDLDQNSCESIEFIGFKEMEGKKPKLQQGDVIDPNLHFMKVRLKVNQVGTYTMSANSNNGYFFSGEGQFQAIGSYDVLLKGMGTPIKGYDPDGPIKGDKLKFTVNGIDSKVCTDTEIIVLPADLDFSITSTNVVASGKYYVGHPATLAQGNSMVLNINVVSGGLATITATNEKLGMKFVGSKKIEPTDTTFTLEPVLGENIPVTNDAENYEFAFTVNTKDPNGTIKGSKAKLIVEKTQIEGVIDQVKYGKEPYYQGGVLNENHIIELPIKVISSGKQNLYLKGSNLEFKAEDVMLTMPVNEDDTQLVKFTAVKGGKLPLSDTVELTLSGDIGKRFEVKSNDKLALPLAIQPVAYTIDCKTAKTNKTAIPVNKPVGEGFNMTVSVNVSVLGEYEINTSSAVDGILFSTTRKGVKQKFTKTGIQTVTLYPIDTSIIPTKKGEYTINLVANDPSNALCSGVKVRIGFGELSVLIIRGESYYDGYDDPFNDESIFFTGRNNEGKFRFGEFGTFVKTGNVSVTKVNIYARNFVSERTKIVQEIKDGKYSFIMLTGRYAIFGVDQNLSDALYDYTVNNKGILWLQTPYLHLTGSKTANYVDEVKKDIYKNVNFTGKSDVGIELVKRFNNNSDLRQTNNPSDKKYNMYVINETNELTKPKNGYRYSMKNNGDYYDIHWNKTNQDDYYNYINPTGSRYKAIIADRKASTKGLVFEHSSYPNLIWAPISSSSSELTMTPGFHINGETGEPFNEDGGGYNVQGNIGTFCANVFAALIERLMNN